MLCRKGSHDSWGTTTVGTHARDLLQGCCSHYPLTKLLHTWSSIYTMNEDLDDATPAEGPIVDAHGLSPDARGQLTVWSLNAFKHDEDYDMYATCSATT